MRGSSGSILLGLSLALGACSSVPPSSATSCSSVAQLEVDNGLGTLGGTLETPEGCGPFPLLLVVPGSGPTDRNGNQYSAGLRPNSYGLLASGLARRGIASLRYDKAGVAASVSVAAAQEADFRFEMGADDAALWLARLRDDTRFNWVGLIGHSEGALLGLLTAKQQPLDGYISLEGAGRPIAAVLREQLSSGNLDPELTQVALSTVDQLERGERVTEVPTELAALFRPSVQPYLTSWMNYDPAAELAALDAPAMVVQGTTDVQISLEDAELLSVARPDATKHLVEGMNHTLKSATLEPSSQERTYGDPTLPVVEELFIAVEAFVTGSIAE